MQTLTAEQFKTKYGIDSSKVFKPTDTQSQGVLSTAIDTYKSNVVGNVASDINTRVGKVGDILSRQDTGIAEKGLQLFGQGAGLAANTLETAVGQVPGIKQAGEAISGGMNWLATSNLSPIKHLGDIIGQSQTLQEAVRLYDTDKNFKDTIDAVANTARLGGDISAIVDGANYAKNVTKKIIDNVKSKTATSISTAETATTPAATALGEKTSTMVGKITKDILPTTDKIAASELVKALDLTQGDVRNISLSTGNDVGKFMMDKNLLGADMIETSAKVKDFFDTSYKQVRAEIAKVKSTYKATSVPRYQEALIAIKAQVKDVPGLQTVNKEIDTLLKKKIVALNDVQRVKELMDEHFSLYKATGDVAQGVQKSGLANIRTDLKKFIETKVKDATGVDIKALNNDVSTSRAIQQAIESRSTRGLTRATITPADIITFLTGSLAGSPVSGAIALVAKKIYESPTFKLRLANWLDGLSDARRLEIQKGLEKGILPPEIKVNQSIRSIKSSSQETKRMTDSTIISPKSDNVLIQDKSTTPIGNVNPPTRPLQKYKTMQDAIRARQRQSLK